MFINKKKLYFYGHKNNRFGLTIKKTLLKWKLILFSNWIAIQ